MTEQSTWYSTKDSLPVRNLLVLARNPYYESISWICDLDELGKPAWCHKDGWKHADDFVSEWRFLNEDEIVN